MKVKVNLSLKYKLLECVYLAELVVINPAKYTHSHSLAVGELKQIIPKLEFGELVETLIALPAYYQDSAISQFKEAYNAL